VKGAAHRRLLLIEAEARAAGRSSDRHAAELAAWARRMRQQAGFARETNDEAPPLLAGLEGKATR